MTLHPADALREVRDRASFLTFVRALADDRADEARKESERPSNPYGPGATGWENTTIEAFLEAALSWADDSGKLPEHPSWRAFAEFLYCGKIYE